MIEPRAKLKFLYDEWPVVQAIFKAMEEQPAGLQVLYNIVRAHKPDIQGRYEVQAYIDRLKKYDVLVCAPGSETLFEMGAVTERIVTELMEAHRLGLAESVKLYLQEVEKLGGLILKAARRFDMDTMNRHIRELHARIKEIQRQLGHDLEAITEIVTKAKTRRGEMPLKVLYREVLDTWERYIQPLESMVNIHHPFEEALSALEANLRRCEVHIQEHRGLISDIFGLEQAAIRIIDLRISLREHLGRSTRLLMPLVQEARRNTAMASGASAFLREIRKRGLGRIKLDEQVLIHRRPKSTLLPPNEWIASFVATIANFKEEPVTVVVEPRKAAAPRPVVTRMSLLAMARAELPIPDVMAWLIRQFPEAELGELIQRYFLLTHHARFKREKRAQRDYQTARNRISTRQIALLKD